MDIVMKTSKILATLTMVLASVSWADGQPSMLTNARVQVQPVSGSLQRTFDALVDATTEAAWIAYAAPIARRDSFLCDWDNRSARPTATAVKLEGADRFYVFYRVEARSLDRIRMFSEGCSIDASGLQVTWLQGVVPGQSVALLARHLRADASRRVANGALAALAMHEGEPATAALLTAARSGVTAHIRGQALFWTAQRAGDRAIPVISEAIANDPETDVKKRAVFALSQLPAGEGVPRLIDVAEHHSNPAVRKQAMFWLGQSRDPRALAFFERILLK